MSLCALTESKIENNGFSLIKAFDSNSKSISERHLEKQCHLSFPIPQEVHK